MLTRLGDNRLVPGGRKRKRDFATEEEWEAYKAEVRAREAVRWGEQLASEEAEMEGRRREWSEDRARAGAELLAAWNDLYTGVIATNEVELVQVANRLHRATAVVIDHLLDESSDPDYWPEELVGNEDPLEALPQLFDEVVHGPRKGTEPPPPELATNRPGAGG